MAYGGPDRMEDVEPYILDVRHHRPTSAGIIEEMQSRYRAIGGRSPILEHTRAQAVRLGTCLREADSPLPVYIGMRHWHPYIGAAFDRMRADGITEVVGLVMAPHYSSMSVGAYFRSAEEGRLFPDRQVPPHNQSGDAAGIEMRRIDSWHMLLEYLDTVESLVRESLEAFPAEHHARVHLLFTAHSLPERIRAEGDPYPAQLEETVEALAGRFPGQPHSFAYQSAAMTPDPWLGPDAGEVLRSIAAHGGSRVLIVPIGFTSEHVEILFDIDIEYARLARQLGLEMRRIRMMNDDARMMAGLARRVIEELAAVGR
jgi:ferrochelatase